MQYFTYIIIFYLFNNKPLKKINNVWNDVTNVSKGILCKNFLILFFFIYFDKPLNEYMMY